MGIGDASKELRGQREDEGKHNSPRWKPMARDAVFGGYGAKRSHFCCYWRGHWGSRAVGAEGRRRVQQFEMVIIDELKVTVLQGYDIPTLWVDNKMTLIEKFDLELEDDQVDRHP